MSFRNAMHEDLHEGLQLVEEELSKVEAEIERLLVRQQQLNDEKERLRQRLAVDERAPKANWQGSFEWDSRVAAALQTIFGLDAFRPLQREVINATLQGRDCLCLLPAGGGKSLCYQLPAVMEGSRGVTLVVSPLLSLIQDQVLGLKSMDIQASSLTSLTSKDEAMSVNQLLDNPHSGLRLLYCTPEKIVNSKRFISRLEKMYKAGRLARIAIDEAHCCSEWGNDFRPDYKKLGVLKQQFPDTPLLALTATATHTVCDSLQSILRIGGCEVFRGSTNRPNLFYEVRPKPASQEALADELAEWVLHNYPQGDSGIVYCLTRKDCEQVSQQLSERRVRCAFYHADMEPAMRQSVHSMWSQGRVQLIVATIAFGMGINKTNVRFVVHHSLSKSLENHYQESGRAGRDGQPAHCRMYFRLADYMRQAGIVVMESSWERHLTAMLRYVTAHTCRRSLLSRHFGEVPAPCHGMCDVCRAGAASQQAQQQDVTAAAAGALSTLGKQGQENRATLTQLLDKWRSNKEGGHGAAAKSMSKDENEFVVQHMLLQGSLQLDFGFTAYATNVYLKAGPKAGGILQGKHRMTMPLVQLPVGGTGGAAVKPGPCQERVTHQPSSNQQQNGRGPELVQEGDPGGQKQKQLAETLGEAASTAGHGGDPVEMSARPPQQIVDLLSSDSDSDFKEGSLGKKRQRRA